jgi:hypothetical protein
VVNTNFFPNSWQVGLWPKPRGRALDSGKRVYQIGVTHTREERGVNVS